MEFLNELTVWTALLIVISLILTDWFFGVLTAIKGKELDVRKLPQVIATNVFPYVGGLSVLGVLAEYIGQPYSGIFYLFAVSLGGKYFAEIKDKAVMLLGTSAGGVQE